MIERKDNYGNVLNTSKNLSGLRRWAKRYGVTSGKYSLSTRRDGSGVMYVRFADMTECFVRFASCTVMQGWIRRSHTLRNVLTYVAT